MPEDQIDNLESEYVLPPYAASLSVLGNNVQAIEEYMTKSSRLPPSIQKILHDFSTAEYIEEKLGPAFGLSAEQKSRLVLIVGSILMAETFIGNIVEEISGGLGLDQNRADQISSAIISELLPPAMEDIKRMHKEKFVNVQQQPAPRKTFSNPGANLDINKTNVLDLRNRNQ